MGRITSSDRVLDRLADYSDLSLLNELRRIAVVVGRDSLTLQDIDRHGRCSYATLKNKFGGLNLALKAAGLGAKNFNRDISDDELLLELDRTWDLVLRKEGRRPYKDDLVKYDSKYSSGPYYRRWGSWIKACEALLDWRPSSYDDAEAAKDEVLETATPFPSLRQKRPIPLRIRYAILVRDSFTCQLCGCSPSSTPGLEVDIDHIVSEANGGTLDPTNLRCLCKPCNLGKGSHSGKPDANRWS